MELNQESPGTWKSIKTVDDAKNLIDMGVLLVWSDFRYFKKSLKEDDQIEIARYFAVRLAERVTSRFPEEILIESLLVMLTNSTSEVMLNEFLKELVQQTNPELACQTLVELAITADISDTEHYGEIFAFAVSTICQLGSLVREKQESLLEEGIDTTKILDHISTYLLSVSNSSDMCVRLSLVYYFGAQEKGTRVKPGFNRIMSRFGHTVLEHLFTLLFNKKTEAIALQYLLENSPYILEGDDHCQKILHETWKFYMLKRPERFSLFIQAMTKHISDLGDDVNAIARVMYLQHLGVLLKKASEVNHKVLGREIMGAMAAFPTEPYREYLIQGLTKDKELRESFRTLLVKLLNSADAGQVLENDKDSFKSSKRGRRPCFAKAEKTKPIFQAAYLGNQVIVKAS